MINFKKIQILKILGFVPIFLVSLLAAPSVYASWSSAVNVSNNSTNSNGPKTIEDSAGTLHTVWCDNAATNYQMFYSQKPSSGNWSSAINISQTTGDCNASTLRLTSDGTLHVVWEDTTSGPNHIFYANRTNVGSWSTSVDLTSSAGDSVLPSLLVASDDTLHLIWDDTSVQRLFYISKPSAGGWSSPAQITSNSGGSPSATIDSNDAIHVVRQVSDSGVINIYYMTKPDGGSWSSETLLSDCSGAANCAYAVITSQEDTLYAVWHKTVNWPADRDIYYTTKPNAGSWSTPVNLTGSVGDDSFVYNGGFGVDGSDNPHIVWQNNTSGTIDIFYSEVTGGNWSTPLNLSNTSSASFAPSLTLDASNYPHVVWSESVSGSGEIYYLTTAPPPFVCPGITNEITRIVASDGSQANGSVQSPAVTADGRFVSFESFASNLVPGDTNDDPDVFVYDRESCELTRVSVASDGTQGNDASFFSHISDDGRYVSFDSDATNLVSGDTNGVRDIFVHDLQTSTTTRVSVASDGSQANSGNTGTTTSISGDGRYVAFGHSATNLVSGGTNGTGHVFVHDRQTGTTTLVTKSSGGTEGNNGGGEPSFSADGRYISFHSNSSNLVSGDTNNKLDVFVHDLQTSTTTRVSVASDGTQGNNESGEPTLSSDGRYVGFQSETTNLVSGDTNGVHDAFVHDRQTGTTIRVSVASDGTQSNGATDTHAISTDGNFSIFRSSANNLVAGDTNGVFDIFVKRLSDGEVQRASIAFDNAQANALSEAPVISEDGQYSVFRSLATNLVSGDTNGVGDVFIIGGLFNEPPTVDANGPYSVNEGGVVEVSATGNDPENQTLTYAWDLDDNGSFETSGQTVNFSAASADGPGSQTIAVQVTDNGNLTATDEATVNINNVAPTATFANTSGTINEDTSATLSFSSQSDPSSADTTAGFVYSYDCTNDGSFEVTDSASSSNNCLYPTPGSFTAKGRIKDKDGGFTDYTASVTVNNITTADDFVVLGYEGISVKQGADILSGNVGANTSSSGPYLDAGVEASIGIGATLSSTSKLYGDSIKLKNNSQVYDVFYNDIDNSGTINGSQSTPLSLPVVSSFPTVPSFSVGTTDVTVPANTSQSLSAGSYEDLIVHHDSILVLSGGTYNFASWDLRDDAKVYIDSATEIRISGKLNTNIRAQIKPNPTSSIDASDIKIFVTGVNGGSGNIGATPKAADFGQNNVLTANVYTPNGTLFLKEDTTATGAFLGKWVVVGQDNQVSFDSAF